MFQLFGQPYIAQNNHNNFAFVQQKLYRVDQKSKLLYCGCNFVNCGPI